LEAALKFEMPEYLKAETLMAAVRSCNKSIGFKSGRYHTPYSLMKGIKPTLDRYSYGSTGIAYTNRLDTPGIKAEWGILLNEKQEGSYTVYIPSRRHIYSVRKFEVADGYPLSWGLTRKNRTITNDKVIMRDNMVSVTSSVDNVLMQPVVDLKEVVTLDDSISNASIESRIELQTSKEDSSIVTDKEIVIDVNKDVCPDIVDNNNDIEPSIEMETVESVVVAPRRSNRLIEQNKSMKEIDSRSRIDKNSMDVRLATCETVEKKNINRCKVNPVCNTNSVLALMARPSSGSNEMINPVLNDEVRFMKHYGEKREKNHELHIPSAVDDTGLRPTSEYWEESIKMVRSSLNDESFRDAICAYQTSLSKAMNDDCPIRREEAEKSGRLEVRNIVENKTIRCVKRSQLTSAQKGNIHRSFMFMKDKVDSGGEFDKFKARLVINGSTVDVDGLGDLYAATVQPISVFTMIAIATTKGYDIGVFDIKGAYLIPDVKEGEPDIIMKVDRHVAALFVKEYPYMQEYLDSEGCLYMLLLKYLYGLPQAAAHFAEHLKNTLKKMNMRQTKVDGCVHVRKGEISIDVVSAATWVDDLIVTSKKKDLDTFEVELRTYYDITSNRGDKLSYISLYIEKDNACNRLVSQKGYRLAVLNKYRADVNKIKGIVRLPAHENLVKEVDDSSPTDPTHFLSIVMALMYLARLTRYDILFVVCYLATRSSKPSSRDYMAACRVLRYLECSGDFALLFRKDARFEIKIGADSSHRMYPDGKGQGGITVSVGSALVHGKSYKIKLSMLSTFETEGYVMCEAATYVPFMISLCRALGAVSSEIASIKQDNQSTIWLQTHDGKFGRNKHILARDNYTKELIEDKLTTVSHADTDYLNTDMFTKVSGKERLGRHMKRSGMVYIGGGICNSGGVIENISERKTKKKIARKGVINNMPIDSRTLFKKGYRSVIKD